jgi:putative SOS response-associated peptidase YedK
LIPCDGFYEWKKVLGGKIPYSISMKDNSPFVFAGLWEGWKDPANGEWLHTCTIITGEPNEFVREIHTRISAKVIPPAFLIACIPFVPSDPLPERITPMTFGPLFSASERKKVSMGRWGLSAGSRLLKCRTRLVIVRVALGIITYK